MITEKEVQAVELSATKKDFYQIWNELMDTASKISERWDPTSTNESDPGIVLLKVLTAIADKLNYNIDVNTLQAFMPSASQQEAMRKLCEMLGYNMKYYRSGTTDVTVSYIGDTKLGSDDIITIGQFTNIKNQEDDINYVTTVAKTLSASMNSTTIPCIEGELVPVETDTDNIVSLMLLDDNQRYYLPETQIAENGIFVYNVSDGIYDSVAWKQVDNLNTQTEKTKCFKFGFDSRKGVPYIQFPDDISSIIGDGLIIYYIRTHGINGNISPRTLSVLTKPSNWQIALDDGNLSEALTEIYGEDPSENFMVTNTAAVTNGTNIETIDQAYNNYKKTIGTFDTLVTCRDYMNKIYQLTWDDGTGTITTPLVSNVIVSDIRDDINNSVTLCSFNEYGIVYSTKPANIFNTGLDIDNFDLILYPFRTYYNLGTKNDYEKSFTYDPTVLNEITRDLEDYKTISHTFNIPETGSEIILIKNYLKLKAKITTTRRVNSLEEKDILNSIYTSIYNRFNMRQLDFGEEIPFDDILDCISKADIRIKNIALEEPVLYTTFVASNGTEYDALTPDPVIYEKIYDKLALRNVLAGKISLFDYDDDFAPEFNEVKLNNQYIYESQYPTPEQEATNPIISLESALAITGGNGFKDYTLNKNEVIQFRAPNFKTEITYPAYVNYYLIKTGSSDTPGIPATFQTLETFMGSDQDYWPDFINANLNKTGYIELPADEPDRQNKFNAYSTKYSQLFYNVGTDDELSLEPTNALVNNVTRYYYIAISDNTWAAWSNFVSSQTVNDITLSGIYRRLAADMSRSIGELVDIDYFKYQKANQYIAYTDPALQHYFVQVTHTEDSDSYTKNGLGRNANYTGIAKNTDYRLDSGEFLYINYSTTTSTDAGDEKTTINEVYKEGDIIRPNFDIIDSNTERHSHVYSKTNGFDTSKFVRDGAAILGMFTLDADQQIEIRRRSIIELNNKYTNIYWERNDENLLTNNDIITFKFDADGTYTLKPGEIFAYTDINKIDMAYYGSGTTIKKSGLTPDLVKYKSDAVVSAEEIANQGLSAAIPWRTYDLSGSTKAINIIEHQYVNLTAEDTLNTFNDSTIISGVLNSSWTPIVGDVYYTYSDGNKQKLPSIAVPEATWEARSILELNVGPDTSQTLIKTSNVKESITLTLKDIAEPIEIKSIEGATPITFKTNYLIMSSAGFIDTTKSASDDDATVTDFKVELFEINNENVPDNVNDFGGNFTKLTFERLPAGQTHYTLNVRIPENKDGLIMLYYVYNSSASSDPTTFTYIHGTNNYAFEVYNKNAWWGGSYIDTDNHNYFLRPGINVIKLTSACTEIDLYSGEDTKAAVIAGNPSIVNGINNKLNYSGNNLTQALADILLIDPDYKFFYNCPIDNSIAIDLNKTDDEELLSSPTAWYDYNNENNKFVISEISAKDMIDGITLTSSSRI